MYVVGANEASPGHITKTCPRPPEKGLEREKQFEAGGAG